MELKEKLQEQFSFLKLKPFESKKDYKKRIIERGYEIFKGINCTLEDTINLMALHECQAEIIIMRGLVIDRKQVVIGDLTTEEYTLRKGYAKDYEKYINIVFFKYLDEDKFKKVKERIYNETIKKYINNNQDSYFGSLDYYEDKQLIKDEYLEKQYGERVTRENKQKIITRKMRRTK